MAAKLFRYVALGDSTSVGVGDQADGGYPERLFRRLKLAGINAGILNLAQSGATTSEVLQRQGHKAVATSPCRLKPPMRANRPWRLIAPRTFLMNLKLSAHTVASRRAELRGRN